MKVETIVLYQFKFAIKTGGGEGIMDEIAPYQQLSCRDPWRLRRNQTCPFLGGSNQ